MRILMVSFLVPHSAALSGAGLVMHGELAILRARHEMTLVTFAPTDATDRQALKQLRASGLRVHVVGESWPIAVIRCKRSVERLLGRARGWPALGNPIYADPRLPRLLDRLIEQQRFDLLQVEDIGLGTFSYTSPIPSILVEHEVRDGKHFQAPIWRQFDRIQVFTNRDGAALCDAAPDLSNRVSINPFGVEVPEPTEIQREEPDTVLFVGGFNHPPNVDAALWLGTEIMPLLRTLRPNARLLIVGSDPPKHIRALQNDHIVVTGRVQAVEGYLERAAVVLAPLRVGGGMRVKVLQAMARAKAIVTTPLGIQGLLGDRSQLPIVVAESAEDIAREAAELLACRDARQAIGQRAQHYVREYHSWSGYRQRLEETYAKLKGSIKSKAQ